MRHEELTRSCFENDGYHYLSKVDSDVYDRAKSAYGKRGKLRSSVMSHGEALRLVQSLILDKAESSRRSHGAQLR